MLNKKIHGTLLQVAGRQSLVTPIDWKLVAMTLNPAAAILSPILGDAY